MGELYGVLINWFFLILKFKLAELNYLSLSGCSVFNSEHILLEMNTDTLGPRQGKNYYSHFTGSGGPNSSCFLSLASWASAGPREEDYKLWGKNRGYRSYRPPNQGGTDRQLFPDASKFIWSAEQTMLLNKGRWKWHLDYWTAILNSIKLRLNNLA